MAPLVIERLEIMPAEIVGGELPGPKGIVTLSAAGVDGISEVALTTDKPAIVSLPGTVDVAAGQTSATFDIGVAAVAGPTATAISATLGAVSCNASLVVYPVDGVRGSNGTAGGALAETAVAAPAAPAAAVSPTPLTQVVAPNAESTPTTAPPPGVMPEQPDQSQQPNQPQPPQESHANEAWQPVCKQSLGASLLSVIPALPYAALVFIVAIYTAPPIQGALQIALPLKPMPVLAGLAMAVVSMLLAALVIRYVMRGTSAESSNPAAFGELMQRIAELDARLAILALASNPPDADSQSAHRRAQVLRSQMGVELQKAGSQWVLGTGYINAWRQIHRAEEALLAAESRTDTVAAALYDELRLTGSQIANSPDLLLKLRRAVTQINPAAAMFLNQSSISSSSDGQLKAADEGDALGAAHATLAEVRHTINAFRDDNWAGLVRSRNNLVIVLTTCGWATVLLLVASLNVRVPGLAMVSSADPILSATIFYLVGAVVGLFNRLYAEASSNTSVDDYGLTLARLSITPVLSGLAGVGGVLLVALVLSGVGGFAVSSAGAAAAARTLPMLADILNLQTNQFGVIVAATFGLAPQLLVATLQGQANQYTAAIKSTAAPSTSSS